MSQTTQSNRRDGQGDRHRRDGQGDRPRRPRREPVVIPWIPKTILGKKVDSGEITKMEEIYEKGYRVKGKGGSVTIEILPGPRGLGLVAGGKIRNLLRLAGLKDAWTYTKGSTTTMNSTSKALLECLRQTFSQG